MSYIPRHPASAASQDTHSSQPPITHQVLTQLLSGAFTLLKLLSEGLKLPIFKPGLLLKLLSQGLDLPIFQLDLLLELLG